jgi:hypothetical protein
MHVMAGSRLSECKVNAVTLTARDARREDDVDDSQRDSGGIHGGRDLALHFSLPTFLSKAC